MQLKNDIIDLSVLFINNSSCIIHINYFLDW